ncbi:MAG: hypothetical protein IPM29_28625 [Planctomycetes bacterium]|nr:hypothetical protein [Planctomycetota bacterium]
MKPTSMPIFAALVLLAVGCGGERTSTPPPAGAGGETTRERHDAGHAPHAERIALGTVEIGALRIEVFQVIELAAGAEGDFDLDFAAGVALPVVRGWIGDESGRGSMKALFERETATRMHGHPEVPDPFTDDALLWLDVEGVGKGSIAVHR